MSGTDLQHRAEIRRGSRTTAIGIGLVVLAAGIAIVVSGRDGAGEDATSASPTTVAHSAPDEPLATTSPRELPPVHGLTPAGGEGALVAFSTAVAPSVDGGLGADGVQAAVVTDGVVVVLAGGRVHAATAAEPFEELVGCCVEGLVPSNEPGHVWLRDDEELALLELTGGGYVTELEIGAGQVLGPASFGVVVLGVDGAVRWHRPSFEPTELRLPGDRRAIDSGGEHLLVAATPRGEAPRLEVWSVTGDGILSTVGLGEGASAAGHLAPDGSVALVPVPGGWEVRDAVTGLVHGRLPEVDRPVWVGGNRFAAALDDRLVVSDRGELPLRWPVRVVAEQSP